MTRSRRQAEQQSQQQTGALLGNPPGSNGASDPRSGAGDPRNGVNHNPALPDGWGGAGALRGVQNADDVSHSSTHIDGRVHTILADRGGTVNHYTASPARHGDPDVPKAKRRFPGLPAISTLLDPRKEKAEVATAQQFADQHWAFYFNDAGIQRDPTQRQAWHEFIERTVEFARQDGVTKAAAYSKMAFDRASYTPPRYDPAIHGPVDITARVECGLSGAGAASPASTRRRGSGWGSKAKASGSPVRSTASKRKGPAADSDQPVCAHHKTSSHSTEDCHYLKRQKADKTTVAAKKEG